MMVLRRDGGWSEDGLGDCHWDTDIVNSANLARPGPYLARSDDWIVSLATMLVKELCQLILQLREIKGDLLLIHIFLPM